MDKEMRVGSKLRKEVISRDNYRCVKCFRAKSLAVHHVIPLVDGGTDELNNLIALCRACHAEWHALEIVSLLSFDLWLKTPPAPVMLRIWHNIDETDASNITLTQWKRATIAAFNYYKQSQIITNEEEEINR